jgi:release factor glutamine methyltransferase
MPDVRDLRSLIVEAAYALAEGPHPERARLDAEALCLHLSQRIDPERNRAWMLAHGKDPVEPSLGIALQGLVERRLLGEPMQYILGETEFYSLPFHVTPDVLIPRRETEHLVEWVISLAAHFAQLRIVDVGAGSGAISIALAHNLPQAELTAIDLSPATLEVARQNAARNNVGIRFLQGDLLAPVAGEQFEIVVSNPPYVPLTDRPSLSVEVRDHEPALALFAGDDGLEVYRRLIPQAFAMLVAGGFLALEIGYGQEPAIRDLLEKAGFAQIEFLPDLQGIARIACGKKLRD